MTDAPAPVLRAEYVTVPEGFGRDSAPRRKMFLIKEWPAERAERWAIDAILAYNRGGGQIPMDLIGGGMEAIAIEGVNVFLRGNMQSEEVVPILNQLLECVSFIADPKARAADGKPVAHPLSADDIMEVKTRFWLRSEVLRVHTGFSMADAVSTLISAIMTRRPSQTAPTSQS
jgi:hypothetical protein